MAAQHPTAPFEERWKLWLLERNQRGMRVILLLGATLYPGFGVLDWVLAPREALPFLWKTRALFFAASLLLFLVVNRPVFARFPDLFSAGYMLLAASGISAMTWYMGGLSSPYYAGLSLCIVGTGLIFVWRPTVVVIEGALVLMAFVVPNLALGHIGPATAASSNLTFLLSIAVVAAIGQIVLYRSQREMLASQVRLEETKLSLERAHE